MGAYGCALHAAADYKHRTSAEDEHPASSRSIDDLRIWLIMKPNNCNAKAAKTIVMFPATPLPAATRILPETSVSVCFNKQGSKRDKGKISTNTNIVYYLIETVNPLDRKTQRQIGIPRILNMYEEYPFWNALLGQQDWA